MVIPCSLLKSASTRRAGMAKMRFMPEKENSSSEKKNPFEGNVKRIFFFYEKGKDFLSNGKVLRLKNMKNHSEKLKRIKKMIFRKFSSIEFFF